MPTKDTTYKVQGSTKRKQVYNIALIVAAVVLAAIVTIGLVSMDQIEEFIQLSVYLVGSLGAISGLVSAALARGNVDPPKEGVHLPPTDEMGG